MAKKKDVAHEDPPPSESVLYIRLSGDLTRALERFIAAQRMKPKKQDVGILAITEFLEREGFWTAPGRPDH